MAGIIRFGRRRLAVLAGTVLSASLASLVKLRRLRGLADTADQRLGQLHARVDDLRRSAAAQAQAVWEYVRHGPVDPRHRSGQTLEDLARVLQLGQPTPPPGSE